MIRLALPLWALIFSVVVTGIIMPTESARGADPSIDWKQIETEHFTIVFDSKHQPLGAAYANAAEQAWTVVGPVFGIWPKKTTILLDDETDVANGSATGFPYPLITAYPVLPTALDSIGDYGDWGTELITHEYTHILNFEPATGVMRPLRAVFGSIIRPNILLPRWYSEGLAVELETRLSNYGRLRSVNYLSIIRAMIEEDVIEREDISRVNEVSIPDWPGGIRPYLMGALIWDEMIRQKGPSIVSDLNLDYSRRLPFFIEGPVKERLGVNYSQILWDTYQRARDQAERQLAIVKTVVVPTKAKLDQQGYFSQSPVISPDGLKLAFIGKEHNFDSTILVAVRADKHQSFSTIKATRVLEAGGGGHAEGNGGGITRLAWLPDSTGLVYDTVKTVSRFYTYSDLWKLELSFAPAPDDAQVLRAKAGKRTQLTHSARAREQTISPSGRAMAFIENTPGGTKLVSSRLDGSNIRDLYEPALEIRVSRPEFINKDELIFAEKTASGAEIFKVVKLNEAPEGDISLASGTPREVLKDFAPVHFPRMTSLGLLFVSDKSGIANLYLATRDLKKAHAISNGTTRIMTGELDGATGDLIYGSLDAIGSQLYATPRQSWSQVPTELPRVGSIIDSEFPAHTPAAIQVNTQAEDYNPWPYMIPQYLLPYAYYIPQGLYFNASTSAGDPVGQHAYSLSVSYDTLTQLPSFAGSYSNHLYTQLPTSIFAQHINEYIYGFGVPRKADSAGLTTGFYLPGLSNDWTGSAGFTFAQTSLLDLTQRRGGVSVGAQWNNVSQKGLEVTPEHGGSFGVTHTQYLQQLGSEYFQTDFHASYYFSKWLPERNALAFFANASIAPGLDNILYGRSTIGGRYTTTLVQNDFVMRGYNSGAFLGRNLLLGTVEYRFPVSYSYEGVRTLPVFLQRIHGAVFADFITLDGATYDFDKAVYRRASFGKVYSGVGIEAKFDATVFYHVPVQFIAGLYYGLDQQLNPYGLSPFLGIGF